MPSLSQVFLMLTSSPFFCSVFLGGTNYCGGVCVLFIDQGDQQLSLLDCSLGKKLCSWQDWR